MNSKHLWSVIIASEDSYDSHDQWSHIIAMNTDCEQSLFIGTAMNLDSERSMIKHIIHDEVGSMLWNAGVHTWSTLILYHIMTPNQYKLEVRTHYVLLEKSEKSIVDETFNIILVLMSTLKHEWHKYMNTWEHCMNTTSLHYKDTDLFSTFWKSYSQH